MRLRHIEIFNAIYTIGSISSAAKSLSITQPTASKMLQRLEDQLGFLLFKRVKGKLIPTKEAKILFQETKEIDKKLLSLSRTTANLKNSDYGTVKLAVVHALGIELLPQAITEYNKINPQVQFEIQTHHYDNILSSIHEYDKDVGIALSPAKKSGFSYVDFASGEFVCIYSKGEFNDYPDRLKLSDLEGHPFVGVNGSGPLGDLVASQIKDTNISDHTVIKAQAYYLVRNLVALGAGISIVDEFTARSMGPGVIDHKGFDPPLTFDIKAIHLENKPPSKICMDFVSFFRNIVLSSHSS